MKLKRPLLMGYRGSIGARYAAILKSLGVDFFGVEVDDPVPPFIYDSVIIATPTHMHCEHVMAFADQQTPILLEKPLSTDLKQALEICDMLDQANTPVRMVNQYRHITAAFGTGETAYDYYRSGKDGLHWDTISLIALATGDVSLKQESPYWQATLNGKELTHLMVERAYIDMI